MSAVDVAVPMGVLVTLAIFLQQSLGARAAARVAAIPVDAAMVLAQGAPMPDQPTWRLPERLGPVALSVLLFGMNAAILLLFGVEADRSWLAWAVGGAFLLSHFVVAWVTVRETGRAYRDGQQAVQHSAYFAYLGATSMPKGRTERGQRLYDSEQRVNAFAVALARVPPGVPNGYYRTGVAQARLDLAEALVDARRPLLALTQLDLAVHDLSRWPTFLERGGAISTGSMLADLNSLEVHRLRAAAHVLLGDADGEFDAWLSALRAAPEAFRDHRALLSAARKSGRIEDLRVALVALSSGEEEPSWAQALFDAITVDASPDITEPDRRRGLDELRLLHMAQAHTPPADSPDALRFAEALILSAADHETSQELLDEADHVLGQEWPEDGSRFATWWVHLRTRLLMVRGDMDGAYALAVRCLDDDPERWPFDQSYLIEVARSTGHLHDLRAAAGVREATTTSGRRRLRMLRESVEEALAQTPPPPLPREATHDTATDRLPEAPSSIAAEGAEDR